MTLDHGGIESYRDMCMHKMDMTAVKLDLNIASRSDRDPT